MDLTITSILILRESLSATYLIFKKCNTLFLHNCVQNLMICNSK